MTSELDKNLHEAEALLQRFRSGVLPHFIDGKADPGTSGAVFENSTPIDNSTIGEIAAGNADDIDAACNAAAAAFAEWKNTPGKERKKILHKIADGIEANARDIALIESYDSGQAMRFMGKAAIRGAANFRFFADMAPGARDGQSLPAEEHINYTMRQPIGPVGVITPWNTPFPAEWSPYTAMMLAEIAHDAGLPDGVLNCVQGIGEDAGKALTEHPKIKAVAFVGESMTGSHIMRQGAATLKRVHFELGGKNPVIVFDDADLERALDAVVFMIYSLNGERCTSSSRLLIQESVHDEFVARLQERVGNLRVGHPLFAAISTSQLKMAQTLRPAARQSRVQAITSNRHCLSAPKAT